MRSREEDPDLLYVIKFLAAEEMPGLPPGGGITSKWVQAQANKQKSKKENIFNSFWQCHCFFSLFRRDCIISAYQKHVSTIKSQEPMVRHMSHVTSRQVWLSTHQGNNHICISGHRRIGGGLKLKERGTHHRLHWDQLKGKLYILDEHQAKEEFVWHILRLFSGALKRHFKSNTRCVISFAILMLQCILCLRYLLSTDWSI